MSLHIYREITAALYRLNLLFSLFPLKPKKVVLCQQTCTVADIARDFLLGDFGSVNSLQGGR